MGNYQQLDALWRNQEVVESVAYGRIQRGIEGDVRRSAGFTIGLLDLIQPVRRQGVGKRPGSVASSETLPIDVSGPIEQHCA